MNLGALLLCLAGGLVLYMGPRDSLSLARSALGDRGVPIPQIVAQLAARWGPIFGVNAQTILAICQIESAFRPGAANAEAVTQGGAWGLMQQTLTTARGNVAALRSHASPDVRATVATFDGTGTSLLDPNLNVCLGAYQLGELGKKFGGNFAHVAAGYHQGAGKVSSVLAAGGTIPESLPPKGKTYVTRALAAREAIG